MPGLRGEDEVVGEFMGRYSPIIVFCLEKKGRRIIQVF